MSSDESSSNNATPPPTPGGAPRSSVGMVAFSVILLVALVWAMAPTRAKFQPAPLRPVPPGCPRAVSDFVPSDATEVPDVDLSMLSPAQRNHVLFRLNMEPCPCGCNTSIVVCRATHPTCPLCKGLVEKIVADETAAKSPATQPSSQK